MGIIIFATTILVLCAISYSCVGLKDKIAISTARKGKYIFRRRQLAREYRDSNRQPKMVKTESVIMLPSETFFALAGTVSAIVAEALTMEHVKSLHLLLSNTVRDPFDFAYVEPILAAVIALAAYATTKAATAHVAMSHARMIAERRIGKRRTVCFDCESGVVEMIERAGAGVAAWFTGANERREKTEDVASADVAD